LEEVALVRVDTAKWAGRLPRGEADLPYFETAEGMVSPREAARREAASLSVSAATGHLSHDVSDELLKERIRQRAEAGRVPTIMWIDGSRLTPEQQVREVEAGTRKGQEILQAEFELVQELEKRRAGVSGLARRKPWRGR